MSIKSPYVEKREMRFSSYELEKLRVFKDNAYLLKLLRKVFWQNEITVDEAKLLQETLNKDIIKVLHKVFNPVLNWEEPIFDMGSRWIDRKFSDMLSSEVKPLILARQDDIQFQVNGLTRLSNIINGKSEPLTLAVDLRMERDYADMSVEDVKRHSVAMQDSLVFLESRLVEIRTLASLEEETPEETKERIKKDSSR